MWAGSSWHLERAPPRALGPAHPTEPCSRSPSRRAKTRRPADAECGWGPESRGAKDHHRDCRAAEPRCEPSTAHTARDTNVYIARDRDVRQTQDELVLQTRNGGTRRRCDEKVLLISRFQGGRKTGPGAIQGTGSAGQGSSRQQDSRRGPPLSWPHLEARKGQPWGLRMGEPARQAKKRTRCGAGKRWGDRAAPQTLPGHPLCTKHQSGTQKVRPRPRPQRTRPSGRPAAGSGAARRAHAGPVRDGALPSLWKVRGGGRRPGFAGRTEVCVCVHEVRGDKQQLTTGVRGGAKHRKGGDGVAGSPGTDTSHGWARALDLGPGTTAGLQKPVSWDPGGRHLRPGTRAPGGRQRGGALPDRPERGGPRGRPPHTGRESSFTSKRPFLRLCS